MWITSITICQPNQLLILKATQLFHLLLLRQGLRQLQYLLKLMYRQLLPYPKLHKHQRILLQPSQLIRTLYIFPQFQLQQSQLQIQLIPTTKLSKQINLNPPPILQLLLLPLLLQLSGIAMLLPSTTLPYHTNPSLLTSSSPKTIHIFLHFAPTCSTIMATTWPKDK